MTRGSRAPSRGDWPSKSSSKVAPAESSRELRLPQPPDRGDDARKHAASGASDGIVSVPASLREARKKLDCDRQEPKLRRRARHARDTLESRWVIDKKRRSSSRATSVVVAWRAEDRPRGRHEYDGNLRPLAL